MDEFIGYIVNAVTFAGLKKKHPAKIWYGAQTCWWTHRRKDLCHDGHGLPTDPRGGVLFQTTSVQGFLRQAENDPSQFGEHGLRTFMAGHHANCHVSVKDKRSTCFESWADYARAINLTDRYDREKALPTTLRLFDSAMAGVDPRSTPAVIVDWDLRDDEHTHELVRAIKEGHLTLQDLNRVFGNGRALTKLVRDSPTIGNIQIQYELPDLGPRP